MRQTSRQTFHVRNRCSPSNLDHGLDWRYHFWPCAQEGHVQACHCSAFLACAPSARHIRLVTHKSLLFARPCFRVPTHLTNHIVRASTNARPGASTLATQLCSGGRNPARTEPRHRTLGYTNGHLELIVPIPTDTAIYQLTIQLGPSLTCYTLLNKRRALH